MKLLPGVVLLFLTVNLHALALRPLLSQSEHEQYETVTDSLLFSRTDLAGLVERDPSCRDTVKLFLYLELRLHNEEIIDKTGNKYYIFSEVTEDCVLHLSLKNEAGNISQTIAGIDLASSVDVDLEAVGFENGPVYQDLTHQGIGTAVIEKIRPYMPKECTLHLMVVNRPTREAIVRGKPTTLEELTGIFKSQVIGRWLDTLGFQEFIFKLLPEEWVNFKHEELVDVVTDKTVPKFVQMTAEHRVFYVMARKVDYAGVCEQAGARYIGIQEGIDEIEDMVLFNAPNHTTLALEKSKFSYAEVLRKVQSAMAEFTLAGREDVEFGGPKGELELKDEDYVTIINAQKPHFNATAVLTAA